jgi:hypothetical protein
MLGADNVTGGNTDFDSQDGNYKEGTALADKMDLLPPDLKKHIEDASAALATFSKAQAQAAQKT